VLAATHHKVRCCQSERYPIQTYDRLQLSS